ncbi:MAG TPA: TerC/Alx family metal homeostasis membrane protein [Acidobacteriaceae bacterium]|nr:TerC/Alx family metal homeostasis membrane protein [Acidobacteriaceae bacterium]
MVNHWLGFFVAVAALLLMDLFVLQRGRRPASVCAAWLWTAFLALLACGFALWIWKTDSRQHAVEFLTGYVIEFSLSIDNLFVFLLLFRSLHLDARQQRRVLLWGVMGAIVLRGALILAGTTLLARFAWVEFVFGAILALAALRLLFRPPAASPARGPTAWIQGCCLRYASGTRMALASLLLVVAAVEATDLLFALDSIPAVLAVTRDPWIAFTSNIFAVLGLRSLYFAVAGLLDRFRRLHYALASILGFVALKMLVAHWIEISALVSLAMILGILALFAVLRKSFSRAASSSEHLS